MRLPLKLLDIIASACLAAAFSTGCAPALATDRVTFDIPAQPLDQALAAFSVVSGLQIFYENSLTTGRRSTGVKGMLEPRAALRVLLWGSGLSARVIAAETVSITKPSDSDVIAREERITYIPYYGVIQTSVMKALCQHTGTRPGHYHIALQYWINPAGRLSSLKLIGSSQNAMRDAAVIDAIHDIVLPPPGDMPQPVTMVIEPASQATPNACSAHQAPGRL